MWQFLKGSEYQKRMWYPSIILYYQKSSWISDKCEGIEPEPMRSDEQQKKKGKATDQQGKKGDTRIRFKGRSEKAAGSGTTAEQRLHHFYVSLLSLNAAPNKSVALSQPLTLTLRCTHSDISGTRELGRTKSHSFLGSLHSPYSMSTKSTNYSLPLQSIIQPLQLRASPWALHSMQPSNALKFL